MRLSIYTFASSFYSFYEATDYTYATDASTILTHRRRFRSLMFAAAESRLRPATDQDAPDSTRHERWTTSRRSRPQQSFNADPDQRRSVSCRLRLWHVAATAERQRSAQSAALHLHH